MSIMRTIQTPAAVALRDRCGCRKFDAGARCRLSKGAVIDGLAGHYAGHHGLLGAGAGCWIGHHQAKKRAASTASSNSAMLADLERIRPRCRRHPAVVERRLPLV
jgi:hypothetical protein